MMEVGKKTIVTSMKVQDVAKFSSWQSHENPLFYDYNFPILNRENQISWFKEKTAGRKRAFTIKNFDGQVVGYMALRNVNPFFRQTELGIVMSPQLLERGYGSDGIKTLMNWYFDTLKYRKLFLTVAFYNKRAMHVYKKLGFEYVQIVYEPFENIMFDPFSEENREEYGKLFVKKGRKILSKCIKMQMTKKNYFKLYENGDD